MATVPLSGTDIRLLSGIPFSNDYKNTRWFDTVTEQTNYFLSKSVVQVIAESTFQRIDGYNFISVSNSIDALWGTNYVMFRNTSYNSKWFYGFVTKLEYKNKNTTYVHFEIDVFQTWKFEMDFKPSYVIREHCQLWNTDGSPVLNTVDEGLNYGTEYDTIYVNEFSPNGGYKWLVIISKTLMHTDTPSITPVVVGLPQPLSIYLVPFMDDDTVPNIHFDGTGDFGIGDATISKPTDVLKALYIDESAVNNIVSLYITDFTGIPVVASSGLLTFPDNGNEIQSVAVAGFNCLYVKKVLNFSSQEYTIETKYNGYKTVKESKLLMYPYTSLTLSDFKGNQATYKNEYIKNTDLKLLFKGSLGTSNKTSYGISDYNYADPNLSLKDWLSDSTALINNEPNDVPIITDMLSAYLQGNRNSIINQKDAITFNGKMDLMGGTLGALGSTAMGNGLGVATGVTGMIKGVGNTIFQLQGINAKIKDISNVPPSITKMGSNTSYTIGNDYNGVFIIKKQIKDEYIKN
jgi:hypothetical protein